MKDDLNDREGALVSLAVWVVLFVGIVSLLVMVL
jgi:hypothetical protein